MSASARDRQECWGRSRDSWYSLHIHTGKKLTTIEENSGLVLLLHCEEQVDSVLWATVGNFFALKGHLRMRLQIIVKVCIFCITGNCTDENPPVLCGNRYTNGRNDKSVFALSANSRPTASLMLTEVHIYQIVINKRWYHICHKNFLPCCHKSTEVCILTLWFLPLSW